MSRRAVVLLETSLVVFVAAVVVAEGLLYLPSAGAHATVRIGWTTASNGSAEASVALSAPYDGHFTVTPLLRNGSARSSHVLFYYDPAYPVSYSDVPDWFGLSQHLAAVAGARGFPMTIDVRNATQLVGDLADPASRNETLVFASGVLPAPLFSPTVDRLRPWMMSGGLLIWVGEEIGAYTAVAGGRITCGDTSSLGQAGAAQFVNVSWLQGYGSTCNPARGSTPEALYLNATPGQRSVGIDYPYGIVAPSFRTDRLAAGGGLALGGTYNGSTNIAFLPEGRGGLLDFDAPATDPIRLSIAIDNALQSGLLDRGTELPALPVTWTGAPGTSFHAEIGFPVRGELVPCVFVVQTDYLATFASEGCARAG